MADEKNKQGGFDGFLEGGLDFLRHKPKSQAVKDSDHARSISQGKSGWLPTPLVDMTPLHETLSGVKDEPGEAKGDGRIVGQTVVDCCVLATPGLVGCIAAADSIATGKSFAEGLTDSFRINPKPAESPYKPGW